MAAAAACALGLPAACRRGGPRPVPASARPRALVVRAAGGGGGGAGFGSGPTPAAPASAAPGAASVAGASDGSWTLPKPSGLPFSLPGGLLKREIVQVGEPVLRAAAAPVPLADIPTPAIQKLILEMAAIMRERGVGLAAPQIGVGLQIIVLEDTRDNMDGVPAADLALQERAAFPLKVIINPTLQKVGTATACFYEGCLSVQGYRGLVERHLEVIVTGYGADGAPVRLQARGWLARILQHECDHLQGTVYVDRMFTRSFRRVDLMDKPQPGPHPEFGAVPKQGPMAGRGFAAAPAPAAAAGAAAGAAGKKEKEEGGSSRKKANRNGTL